MNRIFAPHTFYCAERKGTRSLTSARPAHC
jgi:hypothetical protein